jgi:hypothetical protein
VTRPVEFFSFSLFFPGDWREKIAGAMSVMISQNTFDRPGPDYLLGFIAFINK